MSNRLTPRQKEILELASQGYTDGEIAERLSISTQVVKNYQYYLRAKLHARNKTHAVAIAIREGIIK